MVETREGKILTLRDRDNEATSAEVEGKAPGTLRERISTLMGGERVEASMIYTLVSGVRRSTTATNMMIETCLRSRD
jgi:hypothetical protein